MKKTWYTLGIVWMIILAMTGCVQRADKENDSLEEEKLQIGFSADSFVIERWIRDRDVFVSTAQELGAEVNVQNASGDVQEQISQIEYFIQKKMQVIVVVAIDSKALTEVMQKAKEAGIKTICYDRLIEGANADLYISFDNVRVGTLMAEGLIENNPQGGKVFMIQGSVSDNNVELVKQGFLEEIDNSNLEVVYSENCEEWYAEHAYTYAMEGLKEHPEVVGIMSGNDDLAGQVFRALSLNQLAGIVDLVGQDSDSSACQRIVEGTQTMTIYKSVDEIATAAAQYAVKLAKGEDIQVEETIYDGSYNIAYYGLEPVSVNAENIDEIIIGSGFHAREDVYLNINE